MIAPRQNADRTVKNAHILVGDKMRNLRIAQQRLDIGNQHGVIGAHKFDHAPHVAIRGNDCKGGLFPPPLRVLFGVKCVVTALPPINHNRASLWSVGDWVYDRLGMSASDRKSVSAFAAACFAALPSIAYPQSKMNAAWSDPDKALVLDGYEYNKVDLKQDRQALLRRWLHSQRLSYPLSPRYGSAASADLTAKALCRKDWKVDPVGLYV